jgi:hypothetical protein
MPEPEEDAAAVALVVMAVLVGWIVFGAYLFLEGRV